MEQRTLGAVARSLGLSTYFPEQPFALAVTDSRQVKKDDLFFALSGAHVDGHDYLEEVAARGALAAVVAERYTGRPFGLTLLRVADVLEALQTIARKRIEIWKPLIVAVTGSVGKTTTKEFIATLLAARFSVGKSHGNANSQVGLPLTIVNLRGDEEVLVLEMAMTNAGQIANLVTIAPPTIAVITKIAMAHAGNFDNGLKGVAAAKAEILLHPATRLAIIEKEALRFAAVATTGRCEKITATHTLEKADFKMVLKKKGWVVYEKMLPPSPFFQIPFSASHFIEDLSLAIAVARSMGIKWEAMIPKLFSLASISGRFEQKWIDKTLFINDAYNANPESMRAALDNLPHLKNGRKIAVLGGMATDLGPTDVFEHRSIAHYALDKAEHFFCYKSGSLPMKEVFEEAGRLCFYTENMDELRERVFAFVAPSDIVLVKGANLYAMWELTS